jgi:carboxypeptidase family protein/TonB-dependent receptor-like protein
MARLITVALALAFVAASAAPAHAQLDTGSIVGTVADASGGVLPGVTVTATQVDTGVTTAAITTDRGHYVFPALKIGRYAISAELSGFRRAVHDTIDLHVQERREANLTLEVGQVSEEVKVVGLSELLQTQTANMGHAVDERQLKDLPLLGRRYSELALLTPGVSVAPAGITSRGEDTFFNANGNPATWNNYTLDGADNNSFSTNLQERSPQVIQPPVDALQEFRVQTRTYSAEFGKAAGAVVNASIKQGTNTFHGSVFEFVRNDRFNSNRWENERAGVAKGEFNQSIGGGTLGGPIVKSRSFFFGDYQGTRLTQAQTKLSTVPTPLMRQGILTELPQSLRTSPYIPGGCIDPAGKTIPGSCFDPVASNLLSLYPQPNIPQALAALGTPSGFVSPNFISNGLLNNDIDQFDIRTDQNVRTGSDQILARYSFMDVRRLEPPALVDPVASGDFASHILNRGQSLVGGWSRVMSRGMFSEFRASWNRISSSSLQLPFGDAQNAKYGIKGVPENPQFSGGIPAFNIGGVTRIGGPSFRPQYQTSQVFQLAENLSWTRGAHNYKFGGEKRRDLVDYIDLRALNGALTFSDGRYSNVGYADFLLGLASTEQLTLFYPADLYTDGWEAYAQDSWRIGDAFTLNYGVRYEYFTPMLNRDNKMTNIDPVSGQIVYASDGSVYDRSLIHPNRGDFAPRAGFAWTMTPKLVWRGGYGLFYQQTDRYGSESQLALNPPQLVDVSIAAASANEAPVVVLKNGFQSVSQSNIDPTRVQWRIQDPNQDTPRAHQVSIGPEYQLADNLVVDAEYVGNFVRHGRKLRNLNQGILSNPGVGPVVFPYAQYGFGTAFLEQIATDGVSNYHAVQVKLQRRMSRGLAFTSSVTFSRARGNFLDHLSAGGGATGNFPMDAHDVSKDYGPLAYDIPRQWTTSFIYELPVGRGRPFTPGGIAGALASNWAVNGILTLTEGRPFTVGATDRSNTGQSHQNRANCAGDPVPSGFDQTIDHWFDTKAFAEPANFTFGSCGYNSVRGPGFKRMNLSVFRGLPFADQKRVELRIEVFNLFNWVNYDFPGMNVSTPASFGKISASVDAPREMQFAVKFYF